MNSFIAKSFAVALLSTTAIAQEAEPEPAEEVVVEGPVPEFNNKCVECLFTSKHNFYCPRTGNCVQSASDKTTEVCGFASDPEDVFYTNQIGNCLAEPINEVIETKCYYEVNRETEETERANSWIIVSSPSSTLEGQTIFHKIERRALDEAGEEEPRVYP